MQVDSVATKSKRSNTSFCREIRQLNVCQSKLYLPH